MQIRDLDQTVVSNPAYDLVRLTLSLVTAGLTAPLSGIAVARMIEAIATGYSAGLEDPEGEDEGTRIPPSSRRPGTGPSAGAGATSRTSACGASPRACPGASGSSTSRPTRRRPSRPS